MHDGRVVLHQADCRDVLRGLADNSIDSVVTDPPYALVSIQKRFGKPGSAPAKDVYGRGAAGFMGKQWDTGEVAFSEEFWAEVLRVLKPGGHVVAFSGTRTYHRMAVAIEDAGFEIRDQLGWVYGSGFPKSHNQHGDWEGWGTALKPAWEPICLARKPLCGTVAANLAEWGVGAINVDGCRIGDEERTYDLKGGENLNAIAREGGNDSTEAKGLGAYGIGAKQVSVGRSTVVGRWPANILHDGSDEVLAAFPDAKGQQGYVGPKHGERPSKGIYGDFGARERFSPRIELDKSAARFFYCAKASRADRDAGLESATKATTSDGRAVAADNAYQRGKTLRANTHPTVKPTTLMQWLCRLITPPGGIVLDPFMGSGSTGKAAVLEGFQFIGCEREDEYVPIATARIAWAIGASEKGVVSSAVPANDNRPADLFGVAA
ncbi:site-specific DNA-methyltransferase [Agrobacterium tumefaciens]|uniref:DNA-methyltransferase n=1 Tax=Agrobacterium tumefaciens TaxID=358 RepID=UPI0021D06113|nr:site-specific DNA-methyltransferase [Agrobacterium tumefaciens]